MWKNWVGVLEEGNKYKPVVYPKVGSEVETEHFTEAASVGPPAEGSHPEKDTKIRNKDLCEFMRLEQRCTGNEVYIT